MDKKYNHLALVRRDEVIELFKNGMLYPASSIQFSGSIETLPKKTKEVAKLFDKTTTIEYSINYFLLYALTEKSTALFKQGLDILDLVSIYPLDEESKRMGLSLVPPVKLSAPIFEENFFGYRENSAIENARKGVKNIGIIFGYDDLLKSIKKFTDKKHLPILVALVMDETGNRKPESIWEYLISYTRNQIYPNGIRGAFLDTMSVVNNYKKGKIDFKDQKQTTTGRIIVEAENAKYAELVEYLGTSSNFVGAADKAYKDFWKIAPIYFMLLEIFSSVSEDGNTVKGRSIGDFVGSVVKNYDESYLKPALLMLGITLGQSSTYKMLYAVKKKEMSFLE